eukprot:TRINITY_DN4329_c0_g1_i1.p1 TRINITY_DN4329_c0_g1~~TRINITY_DN4329_c0_g1_i1.p1  ORF type:complete len:746 (+),score=153.80 TRINITY_DN4329_c0_g1_i1:92-2329(+)
MAMRPTSLSTKISDISLFDNFRDRSATLLSAPSSPVLPSSPLLSSPSLPHNPHLKERLRELIEKRTRLEIRLAEEERAKEDLRVKFLELGASFNETTEQLNKIIIQRKMRKKMSRSSRKFDDKSPLPEKLIVSPTSTGIPTIINNAMNFLMKHKDEKDLFGRIPSAAEKQTLRDAVAKEDTNGGDIFAEYEKRAYVVASYLKDYLQELPDPIIKSSLYENIITIREIKSPTLRTTVLRSIIQSLPPEHYITLKKLINLLHSVLEKPSSDKNGMTPQKIGSVFGSLILRKSIETAPSYVESTARGQIVQSLIQDFSSIFLHEAADIIYRKNLIESATLDRLAEKLLDEFYPEPNFPEIFFFTHEYYTHTDKLLQQLISMYKQFQDPARSQSLETSWNSKLRLRILQLFKLWTEEQQGELEKGSMIIDTQKFFASLGKNGLPQEQALIDQIRSWIFQCIAQKNNSRSMYTTPRLYNDSFPGIKMNVSLEILEQSPIELAQQLTIIDHALFTKIPPREFLLKSFSKPEESPNFTEMVSKFNRWANWTSHEILKKDNVNQRAEVIQLFIKIADECVRLRNYNSSCAIIGGLNNSAISRLKLSWEKVTKRDTRHYEKLVDLFSMENNFKRYRSIFTQIEDVTPTKKGKRDSVVVSGQSTPLDSPFVPYLALFSKDMSALEENYNNTTDNGLINVHKMRLLWRTVKVPLASQKAYNFSQNSQIAHYLKEVALPSEEELFSRSLICEPRQRT